MRKTSTTSQSPVSALLFCVLALAVLPSRAGAEEETSSPVVVELFTSQACSSCISANKYFRELTGRGDLVALSWHVDYWNQLPTRNGRWEDPYSSAANTLRQRDYNKKIRHRSSVYTPQMIVAGSNEAIGSARHKVSTLIDEEITANKAGIISARKDGDKILFTVTKCEKDAEAFLVTFLPDVKTNVIRGENAGHAFREKNVVTAITALGAAPSSGATFTATAPEEGYGCALIIQEPGQGRILAARYCPTR
ncbi:MAG: coproporphyrinogen III oxidase [Hyphococcus sp.]|nr:MAG: coproporphyrinogen III oxidase [Marinicaulis sp.]